MVSKKQNPPPPKPVEEEYSQEEEVEEEEEDEGHQEKAQVSASSGDETDSKEEEDEGEEDEGEEEAEEESAELTTEHTVRPITVPANIKGSKPNNIKRPLEASKDDGKGSGNGKKAKTGEENDKKGKGSSRIWSEEYEIAVLQGLIDYQKRNGSRPDIGVFYEVIKGRLWDGVTKNQISDKIKRAKRNYSNNVKKGKNGQDHVFSKTHENKLFNLSKQIWGPGSDSNGTEVKAKIKGDDGKGKKVGNSGSETNTKVNSDNPKGKKGGNGGSALIPSMDVDKDEEQDLKMQDLKDVEEVDFLSKFPTLSKSFDADLGFLKANLYLIGHQKAGELEEKWKQLHVEEMAMLAKRFSIQSEQIKMVLDAMEKSSNW